MISLDRFNELKRKVEESEREQARSQGAAEQLKKELKERFGFASVEAGRKALAKKRERLAKEKAAFERDVEAFEEEFHEQAG
jgi:hypothetical protein